MDTPASNLIEKCYLVGAYLVASVALCSLFFGREIFFEGTEGRVCAAAIFSCGVSLVLSFGSFKHLGVIFSCLSFWLAGKVFWSANQGYAAHFVIQSLLFVSIFLRLRLGGLYKVWVIYSGVFVTLGYVYLNAGCWKLKSVMWQDGLGFWRPVSIPMISRDVWIPDFILDNHFLVRMFSHVGLGFEVLFVPLFLLGMALKGRSRSIILGAIFGFGIIFHLSIAVLFPVALFSASMIVGYLLLLLLLKEPVKRLNLIKWNWLFVPGVVIFFGLSPFFKPPFNAKPAMLKWVGIVNYAVFTNWAYDGYTSTFRFIAKNDGVEKDLGPYDIEGHPLVNDIFWNYTYTLTRDLDRVCANGTLSEVNWPRVSKWVEHEFGGVPSSVMILRKEIGNTSHFLPDKRESSNAVPWVKVGEYVLNSNSKDSVTFVSPDQTN